MAELLGRITAFAQHGMVVIRDNDGGEDTSNEWDDYHRLSVDDDSILVGVQPAGDGSVTIEVWTPDCPNPQTGILFQGEIRTKFGRLVLYDPDETFHLQFHGRRGLNTLCIYVDDLDSASAMTIVVS